MKRRVARHGERRNIAARARPIAPGFLLASKTGQLTATIRDFCREPRAHVYLAHRRCGSIGVGCATHVLNLAASRRKRPASAPGRTPRGLPLSAKINLPAIAKTAKAHIAKAEQYAKEASDLEAKTADAVAHKRKKATDHLIAAGLTLADARERVRAERTAWRPWVKKHVGVGGRWADKLISDATSSDPRGAVEKRREDTKAHVREHREVGLTRDRKPHSEERARSERPAATREIASCSADPATERRTQFEFQANQAIRLAKESVLLDAEDSELSNSTIRLARQAATAWANLVHILERRASRSTSVRRRARHDTRYPLDMG